MACTNCAAACKRCDEDRPCARCQRYGISESCQDGQRKQRKKGVKRGSYKRRNKNGENMRFLKCNMIAGWYPWFSGNRVDTRSSGSYHAVCIAGRLLRDLLPKHGRISTPSASWSPRSRRVRPCKWCPAYHAILFARVSAVLCTIRASSNVSGTNSPCATPTTRTSIYATTSRGAATNHSAGIQ